MKKLLKLLNISLLMCLCVACHTTVETESLLDEGISWELAQYRKASISNLRYQLSFFIPEEKDSAVMGQETVNLTLKVASDVILDFHESADKVHEVKANGRRCDYLFQNEHLVIPGQYTQEGDNQIFISFEAGNQGLNRRDGYVYTLFVPDRAHGVFPCFDQPNLKAQFDLDLEIPEAWMVATNGVEEEAEGKKASQNARPGFKHHLTTLPTPIPTYLFAFAAGEFKYQTYEEDGKKIGAYYRETDSLRIAQLPDIMHQVVFSLKWQEDFTGMPYPFPKYDLVILPGFQFGGMEHVGATFYNDNTLFLAENPTPDEQLRRTELIAHETTHMWFGDAVTMDWFNDVWTKEVFANYFAAEITAPLFPDINHDLNWLKSYVASAMSQDRTEGRTSIRQPLDNMRNAGLIYNNIIYNKAPVMMRKMVELMGKDAFRKGIQKYVAQYKYGNATWEDLIAILDAETETDLKAFSRDWVDTARFPEYQAQTCDDERIGREYGIFTLSREQAAALMQGRWDTIQDKTHRQAVLMNLYENYLAGNASMADSTFMTFLMRQLKTEEDPLTASTLISYMYEPLPYTLEEGLHFDEQLWQMAQQHEMNVVRTGLLRLLMRHAETPAVVEHLYALWQEGESPLLSINDFNTMAYELAIRKPECSDSIVHVQLERNTNPDRHEQFAYISRAVMPSQAARDSLFASLEKPENRRIEPWTLSLFYYLNHPLRQQSSVKYIRPALEWLWDIQRTGDIFFPANWCNNLLSGHRSPQAYREVQSFLDAHPDMLPLLRNKVLSAAFYLQRASKVGSGNGEDQ